MRAVIAIPSAASRISRGLGRFWAGSQKLGSLRVCARPFHTSNKSFGLDDGGIEWKSGANPLLKVYGGWGLLGLGLFFVCEPPGSISLNGAFFWRDPLLLLRGEHALFFEPLFGIFQIALPDHPVP